MSAVPARRKEKWMTHRVEAIVKEKEDFWQRYRNRRTPYRRELYKAARNRATNEVRRAKYEYERRVAIDSLDNPKHFWAYARSRTRVKDNVMRLKKTEGDLTKDDKETAQVMNQAFNGVFVEEDLSIPIPTPEAALFDQAITTLEFDEETVREHLEKLDPTKAPGPDGISPFVLKKCASLLCKPLTRIFQTSIDTGEVPDDWRRANITPIFKKGSRTQPLNYRPVSLTSVVSKVMESLVRHVIVNHLTTNCIIRNEQHGFRAKRSCITNLLTYLDDIINAIDKRESVDANYLDCEKAFDRVPHKRLLAKIEAQGIRGCILHWVAGFLSNRTHRVYIRGEHSDWLPVKSGVPQGSVLGPILFIIYINDLVNGLESEASLFADDAKIYRTIKSPEDVEALQRDMDRCHDWSKEWLLTFNAAKCKTMHFGRQNPGANYTLNDIVLDNSVLEKDLGVFVSADLKSSTHVCKVAARANSRLGVIKHSFTYLNKDILRSLYLSLVRPILEYGVQCWSPHLVKDVKTLEKVQHRATKLVPELRDLPYEERCRQLALPTLENRRVRGDMIEVYKILHGFDDIQHSRLFSFNTHQLRGHSLKLSKPDHWRTTIKGNWFAIRVIDPWNALPEHVVTAPSIATFKARYDKHMGI